MPYNLGHSPINGSSPIFNTEAKNMARHANFVEWVHKSAAIVADVERLTQAQQAAVAKLLFNVNSAACWKYHASVIEEDSKAKWLNIAEFCEKQADEAVAALPPLLVKALLQ